MLSALLFAVTVVAAADTLLVNGKLESEQGTFPDSWMPSSTVTITYNRSGAPSGGGVLTFKGDGYCRQYNYKLIEGEQYKISGWFKTIDFKATKAGFVVHNTGWSNEVGIMKFPENSAWTYIEKTFTALSSPNGYYGVALYTKGMKGELQVAGLSLEALTEKGRK